MEALVDGTQKTDIELAADQADKGAGAAGEGGKAGKLKPWQCPDCRTSYRIEKPHPTIAPSMCEFRHADGKLCGRQFYCALTKANAKMIMWPHPEDGKPGSVTQDDLTAALKLMRDLWGQPHGVHASKLYSSVAEVCRIYTEMEKTS